MSLSLLQDYSSGEEGAEAAECGRFVDGEEDSASSLSEGEDGRGGRERARPGRERSIFDHPKHSSNSLLPSAMDVFSEVAGPPEFLNNSVGEGEKGGGNTREGDGRWRNRDAKGGREKKKDLPAGVVVEAKAQLTGIRDRVRSDIDGSAISNSGTPGKISGEGPRVISARDPEPNDAAELLSMCAQCGIPKTYSHTKGMTCLLCGDHPPPDPNGTQEKKKGSTIKDKEKSKRMKGQSTHATWKSETEMQLRQQFD